MADPTFFTVVDSYPIELFFPVRQGCSPQQIEKRGQRQGTLDRGYYFCWMLNDFCRVIT
jgi:hypothetical protein